MAVTKLEDELGDIVEKARIGNSLTVEQVASRTGLSVRDINEIESCRLVPEGEALRSLATALSLDPDKLAEIASGSWAPRAVELPEHGPIVQRIPVAHGGYTENCYIVACRSRLRAAVVDPGGAVDVISRSLETGGFRLELALLTHAHGDHLGGLRALLADRPGVTVVSHPMERDPAMRGLNARWEAARDSAAIPLGDLSVTPLFIPGHTPGSTCYLVDGVCFVGDCLFAGSIGRPGDRQVYARMLNLIRSKVLSLPDATILLPGHGPATTVAEEKDHNPFF